jgi:hypothetical protein
MFAEFDIEQPKLRIQIFCMLAGDSRYWTMAFA